jgi:hypothetical protein
MENDKEKKDDLALTVSIFAALFTLFGLIGTGYSLFYTEKQTELNSTVATFQAQAQATVDSQYAQQLNIQQTQIAMQSQMDAWARQQAVPFVKVIVPPDHIFIVEKITSEEISSGYIITGSGLLEVAFANDGGANATVKTIDWINDVDTKSNLFILSVNSEGAQFPLPNTIEAQTPKRIKLNLEANVPYSGDPNGKSDYQLGEYWKKTLQSSPNHLAVTFSNTDTINIQISDIQLAMPEVGFEPDPPSPFEVTNKTELGIACFSTSDEEVNAILRGNQNKELIVTIQNKDCFSYPIGDYELIINPSGTSPDNKITFSVPVNQTASVDLTKKNPNELVLASTGIILAGLLLISAFGIYLKRTALKRRRKKPFSVNVSEEELRQIIEMRRKRGLEQEKDYYEEKAVDENE